MTAPRCRTCARASGETCGSRSHSSRSRANPSGSLADCIPVTRWPPRITEPANQLMPGRTTSAQITVSKAADSRPSRASEYWPRLASQPAGTSRQPRPALSAPLASHRSCQLSPGWASSQPSTDASPSTRSFCVPALSDANGALVSRLSVSSRFAVVAGQPEVTGRAGNRARMPARASGAGEPGASCSWTRVMTPRSRTGRPAPRAGSRVPGQDAPARPPAGSAQRDGPGPGGSLPPCAA